MSGHDHLAVIREKWYHDSNLLKKGRYKRRKFFKIFHESYLSIERYGFALSAMFHKKASFRFGIFAFMALICIVGTNRTAEAESFPATTNLDINATVALSCDNAVIMDAIVGTGYSEIGLTGGKADNNVAICNVKTNESAGFVLQWNASATVDASGAMKNATGDLIQPFTIASSSETWEILPTASEWGAKLGASSEGYGTGDAGGDYSYASAGGWGPDDGYEYGAWMNVPTSPFQIMQKSSETDADGEWQYLVFGAQIGHDKIQPTGTYTQEVTVTAVTLAGGGGGGGGGGGTDPQGCTFHNAAYGDTVNGTLDTGDCESDPYGGPDPTGYYVEKILFSGTSGDEVTFDSSWPASTGYLYLVDDSDDSVIWNYAYNNSPVSEVLGPVTLPTTGSYTLWVSTWNAGETGNYSITLNLLAPLEPFSNAARVMAGQGHTCASRDDGSVWCWGDNSNGQIGNGQENTFGEPAQTWEPGGAGYFSGASDNGMHGEGAGHSCVRKSDGTVWCWGGNWLGQLGVGMNDESYVPAQVLGTDGVGLLEDVTQLSTGGVSNCALLDDGTVRCWGGNVSREVGDETDVERPAPVQVHGPTSVWPSLGDIPGGFVSDRIGYMAVHPQTGEPYVVTINNQTDYIIMVYRYDGTEWLSVGSTGKETINSQYWNENVSLQFHPVSFEPYVAYADGNDSGRAAVIRYDGSSWIDVGGHPSPQNVLFLTMRLDSSGKPFVAFGKSGSSNEVNVWSFDGSSWSAVGGGPVQTFSNTTPYLSLAINPTTGRPYVLYSHYSIGARVRYYDGASWQQIFSDVNAWAQGDRAISFSSASSQPYIGLHYSSTENMLHYNGSTWDVVGSGMEANVHTLLFDSSDNLYVSGSGIYRFDGTSWDWVSDRGFEYFSLDTSDRPYGADRGGVYKHVEPSVGAGDAYLQSISYVDTGAVLLGEGYSQGSCAVRSGGEVFCWGYTAKGHGGWSTIRSREAGIHQVLGPGGVGVLDGIEKVSVGTYEHACAVTEVGGNVWCWGRNTYGQLGDGTFDEGYYPVQVVGSGGVGNLANVSHVVAAYESTCAVKTDGTVWCWGSNSNGKLGTGDNHDSPEPVQVVGPGGAGFLSGVTQIDARDFHVCALRSDKTVWCWGANSYGQLGDGTDVDSNIPVQVMYRGESGPHADTIPDDFSFADMTRDNEACEELVTSEAVTLTGFDGSLNVSIDSWGGNPEFMINNSGNWVTSGTIAAGQTLRLRQTTAGPNVEWNIGVNVGLMTRPWNVRTNACY